MSFPTISPKQSFPALEAFDEWNEEKKTIHLQQGENIFINPRDIWYVKLGLNIGNEQNGKGEFRRPVLVIRRIGNMYFCIPLTTKGKKSIFYRSIGKIAGKESFIIISQARVLDKKRFIEKLEKLPPQSFRNIKKLLRDIYFGKEELLPSEEGILHREDSSGHL